MLKRLTIQNYALISALDISFPDGLVIITGETGAGKSILLGAISLLLGAKADSSVFCDTTRNCVVEAEFGDETILRRVISPGGRSRSFLNDEPLSLSELTEISTKIIDIHAQHQHLLLSDADYQLSVLDFFAGNTSLLESYQEVFQKHKDTLRTLNTLKEELARESADADYRRFQYEQIEQAHLQQEELEELEQEQKRLANAEQIKELLYNAINLLNPADISLVANLKEASSIASKGVKFLPELELISQRLESAKIELADIEQDLSAIAERISISPERLAVVDDRLSLLYSLMKKHNCTTIAELISVGDGLATSLNSEESKTQQIEQLEQKVEELDALRHQLANDLSERRREAAPKLSEQLQNTIRTLEMPLAQFRVDLSKKENLSLSGGDTLAFLFSANGSSFLGNISKVASGGELSRVMLSLKAILAQYTTLPTMIFDEIDTGVSGRIAHKMGSMIGEMAENMQIFAITHLPQIASKRGEHYLVYKEFLEDGKAQTNIRKLTMDERIMEVARMLSGSFTTEEAVANAKSLLKENSKN